jgi:hypothetical protein
VEVRGLGQLRVTFDDGAALYVDPDPNHESWELHGEGVEGILVGPRWSCRVGPADDAALITGRAAEPQMNGWRSLMTLGG